MKILDFPRTRQSFDYDCGSKALQAMLLYYNIEVRIDRLIKQTKNNNHDGTSIPNILDVIKHYGLKSDSSTMNISDIKNYINDDIPVIISLQAWTNNKDVDWKNNWDDGHYADAIGYDDENLIFMDPSCFYRTSLSYENLMERWHDIGSDGTKYLQHGIAIFGKEPKYKSIKIIPMD
ncbi:MAG: C39 family peptidase [archaeon]